MPRGEPKAGSVVTSITYPKEFFAKVDGLLSALKQQREVPQTLRFNDFVMRLATERAEQLLAESKRQTNGARSDHFDTTTCRIRG